MKNRRSSGVGRGQLLYTVNRRAVRGFPSIRHAAIRDWNAASKGGTSSFGQNIRTHLPIGGYASTIARPLACLTLSSDPSSASRGIAKPEGETMDWKHLLAYITGTVDQEL